MLLLRKARLFHENKILLLISAELQSETSIAGVIPCNPLMPLAEAVNAEFYFLNDPPDPAFSVIFSSTFPKTILQESGQT